MIIQKKELQKALELVKPGLASKEMIEQSTSFAFVEEFVMTFNDEVCMSHPIKDMAIEGAIQAEELYKLLPRLKQDEIDITQTEGEIQIKCGRTKVGLTLQDEIKLPLDSIGKKGKWKPLHENFIEYVKMAMGSCGTDMSKPILTCVHVHKDGIIEGSDGMKIMRCELDKANPIDTFLLPARNAAHLIGLNPTHVATGKGWVHFKTKSGTVASLRIFEDEYPNTDDFMKMEGTLFTLPKSFIDILDRASIFSKRDHILDEAISVNIADKRIQVKAESDSGWVKEKANIRYDGDPIKFSIAPYLLMDILKQTQECEISDNRLKFEGQGWSYITRLF